MSDWIARKACRPLIAALALGLLLTSALTGCGNRDGPPRVAVEGSVTLDGVPLKRGSILFRPTNGTVGPEAGGIIQDGRYRLSEARGLVIGQLRVEIRAEQNLGFDPSEPAETVQHIGQPWPKNRIPAIYNDRSTLVVKTTATGSGNFDFALRSTLQNPRP